MENNNNSDDLKKEVDRLMKIKGEERGGAPVRYMADFILKEEGEEGLKQLEDTIAEFGYPIELRKVKPNDFYPLGLGTVLYLVSKKLFNYDDKKLQEMSRFKAKYPALIRFLMGYFISLERFLKESPKLWRRQYTVGEFKVIEYNKEEKYIISRLKNFRIHPTHCQALMEVFSTLLQMIVKSPVTCEETKCVHREDEYHEFLTKW